MVQNSPTISFKLNGSEGRRTCFGRIRTCGNCRGGSHDNRGENILSFCFVDGRETAKD